MTNCQDQNTKKDILRFAPSPTGEPHIGNIRTALINYIYGISVNADMKLRIEDTDKERSKNEYLQSMLKTLKWLNISYTGEPIVQSKRIDRHISLANELLSNGKAYKCFCNVNGFDDGDLICDCRNKFLQREQGSQIDYQDIKSFAIKLHIEKSGEMTLHDKIKGSVMQKNDNLQDVVLVRTDGLPTYMFCVVVDDHDMGVTLVIRGDDHLTNTFKQMHIYNAFGWNVPSFAHLPMLLSADGSKLSKRNSVTNLQDYMNAGILPDALKNYLLLLSWKYERVQKAHNIEVSEIFDVHTVAKYFSLSDISKSPSKFDFQKLLSVNATYISLMNDDNLINELENFSNKKISQRQMILQLMPELKKRSKTLKDLERMIQPYMYSFCQTHNYQDIIQIDSDCLDLIKKSMQHIKRFFSELENVSKWHAIELQNLSKHFAEKNDIKLVDIAQPMRICIVGAKVSPSIFDVMELLGKDEVLYRISKAINLTQ